MHAVGKRRVAQPVRVHNTAGAAHPLPTVPPAGAGAAVHALVVVRDRGDGQRGVVAVAKEDVVVGRVGRQEQGVVEGAGSGGAIAGGGGEGEGEGGGGDGGGRDGL